MSQNMHRTLVLVVVGVLVAVVSSAASSAPSQFLTCATKEGDVLGYNPSAGHGCAAPIIVGADLFRNEREHAGNPGQLVFTTLHLNKCIEFADTSGSADILMPTPGVAIKHLNGKT